MENITNQREGVTRQVTKTTGAHRKTQGKLQNKRQSKHKTLQRTPQDHKTKAEQEYKHKSPKLNLSPRARGVRHYKLVDFLLLHKSKGSRSEPQYKHVD